jgi:hypothetical protein
MMKVHVVYDAKGEVIATGVTLPPAYDFSQPKSGPMALEEQHVGEMEVPSELTGLSFGELSGRLQVDTEQKPHQLKARNAG